MAQGLAGLGSLGSADPGKLIYEMRRAIYVVAQRIKLISEIKARGGDPVAILKAEAEAKSALAVAEAQHKILRGLRTLIPPDDTKALARAQDAVSRIGAVAQQAGEQRAREIQQSVQAEAWAAEPQWREREYQGDPDFPTGGPPSAMDRLFPGGYRSGGFFGLAAPPRRRRRRRR